MAVTEIVKYSPLLCPPGDGLYDVGDIPGEDYGAAMTPGEAATAAALAAKLRHRILSGEFAAGDRLPSRNDINAEYGVSPESGSVAMRILRDEGLVSLEQGRGTFVLPLFSYRVTVRVPLSDGCAPVGDAVARDLSLAVAAEAPVSEAGATIIAGRSAECLIVIRAADAGRAGMLALMAVARSLPGVGWDVPSASVATRRAK